jgi:hypothetical protein
MRKRAEEFGVAIGTIRSVAGARAYRASVQSATPIYREKVALALHAGAGVGLDGSQFETLKFKDKARISKPASQMGAAPVRSLKGLFIL